VRRALLSQSLLIGGCLAASSLVHAQTGARGLTAVVQPPVRQPSSTDGDVHLLRVRDNLYMMVGAGGNITLQAGKDGVLLVDSGLSSKSDKVLAEIRTVSKAPIRYIINTHVHADHTGGNAPIGSTGITISDNNFGADIAGSSVMPGAKIVAHQSVMDRMISPDGDQPAAAGPAWPNDTFSLKEKKMYFNGEPIVLYHEPAAHTDGDTIVFFRRSDVISTGDLFNVDTYPFIDLKRGGNIQGIIAGLNHIIELAVPEDKQEGGTYVIPGHGRLCDQADVVEYQTMLTIIRDRIQDMIKGGLTLEQVKAAKPTFDYDAHYGQTTGASTAEMFVEAVYKSLKP
jgi:cyclase